VVGKANKDEFRTVYAWRRGRECHDLMIKAKNGQQHVSIMEKRCEFYS